MYKLLPITKVTRDKILPDLDMKTITVGKTLLRINELYFKADSTEISPESFEVLNELYDFLVANPSVVVEIGGHTNTYSSSWISWQTPVRKEQER